MLEGTRSKFLRHGICFRPVFELDGILDHTGGSKRRKPNNKHQDGNASAEINVEEKVSAKSSSRQHNKSLSHALKAAMFNSALAKRIRRKRSSKQKSHVFRRPNEPSFPSQGHVKAFKATNPDDVCPSYPSESKCADYTTDEIFSDYGSEISMAGHNMRKDLPDGFEIVDDRLQRKQPAFWKFATTRFSILNRVRGVHIFLAVLGATVAWGKAGAILFTSIWLLSIFIQKITRPRRDPTKQAMINESSESNPNQNKPTYI